MPRTISYSVVSSTQEVAVRLAKEGAPHGTAVTAESQLLGHGREGRTWVSPKGGLYTSVVLRPEPTAFPLLSLAVGLELERTLSPLAPKARLVVKWPNDLLLAPAEGTSVTRKTGGVLTDIITRPGISAFAVVGVGLNVDCNRNDFPPELQAQVASLQEFSDRRLVPAELGESVVDAVVRACGLVSTPEGREGLPSALQPHLFGVGSEVTFEGSRGTFQGIGQEGEALVQLEDGGPPRSVRAGELLIEVP